MDLVERLLAGNRVYREERFDDSLSLRPAVPDLRLAVVACMDTRHVVEDVLGLAPGEAKVIRSAGAVVDDGVLRSLVAAVHLLDVDCVVHMGHTDCGLKGLRARPEALLERLKRLVSVGRTDEGGDEHVLEETLTWLQPFDDAARHVEDSVARIKTHALIPDTLDVHGLLYDNKTGAVTRIV